MFAGPAAVAESWLHTTPQPDPQFPIYRWRPLVQHDRLNERTIICQPVDPAALYTRDYSAPRTVYDTGTLYQTTPGGGARDRSIPPIELNAD